ASARTYKDNPFHRRGGRKSRNNLASHPGSILSTCSELGEIAKEDANLTYRKRVIYPERDKLSATSCVKATLTRILTRHSVTFRAYLVAILTGDVQRESGSW